MTMTKNQPLRRLYGYNYANDKIDHFGDFMDTTMTMTKIDHFGDFMDTTMTMTKIDHFGDVIDTTMTMTKMTTLETLWIKLHCMIMTKFVYSYNDLRTSVYKK